MIMMIIIIMTMIIVNKLSYSLSLSECYVLDNYDELVWDEYDDSY